MPDPRHVLGQRAEVAVAAWLVDRGWRVLARRWRCPSGELDLVVRDPEGTLVGVEVKLRRSRRTGDAAEAVDARRVGRLRAALAAYAREAGTAPTPVALRIDLVTVEPADGCWRLRRLPAIDGW